MDGSGTKFSISGYVSSSENGEALYGATIHIKQKNTGTSSNAYGFYSITLDKGTYAIEYRYLGYTTQVFDINLNNDIELNVQMDIDNRELDEIVIVGQIDKSNIAKNEISLNRLDIKTVNAIPAFLGEVDILKSIQLLPGVSSVGEGAPGFNVRGGSTGQNLILMDEAPVFTSSHLLGFFSIFNPDAVRNIQLYKGGIPATYGGRISSVLDIKMKEGNNKRFSLQGGVGTIFSRLAIQAPIKKDKSAFIVTGRRSYIDVLAKPIISELDAESQFYFYDLSLNAHYNFNDRNKIYLSAYMGRDVFKVNAVQGLDWGSKIASLRWNYLFSKRLFANFNLIYSGYDYGLEFFDDVIDRIEWNSNIKVTTFKPQFSYFINARNIFDFGGEFSYYSLNPASGLVVSNFDSSQVNLSKRYAAEWSLYVSNELTIGQNININYGFRGSGYFYLGPGYVYKYEEVVIGKRQHLIDIEEVSGKEVMHSYFNFEPRVSVKYQLNTRNVLKASYSRLTQNFHLISNTTATNPLDIWIPSTNNIKPEIGDLYGIGYMANLGMHSMISASVEAYYRSNKNQIDYIDGAQIYINEYIEGELLSGKGRSYGLEFYVEKTTGKIQGWISYTIGRSELKVEGINLGEWYPTRYDQLHNLKIAGFYKLNDRWSLSSTFTFLSGTPTTFPTTRLDVQDYLIPYNYNYSRNDKRIPNYHRLDLSVTLDSKKYNKKGKEKRYRDYWVFGLYNLYARQNPFSIYFSQGNDRPETGEPIPAFATQFSIIGTIVPGISYNFRF